MPIIHDSNEIGTEVLHDYGNQVRKLMHRMFKTGFRIMRAGLEQFGLTPGQFGVLDELHQCDGLTLNALAERMHGDAPTTCGFVEGTVQAGFVERRADPKDRRRLNLYLTPKAIAEWPNLAAVEAHCTEVLMSRLTDDERQQFIHLLSRINGVDSGE